MTTDRLQLMLIPDLRRQAQPLAASARARSVELIAMMLVRLVRAEPTSGDGDGDGDGEETRDESR